MTDGDRLLAAILAAPDEDTPRLMYADWLGENGVKWERDWAAFIRAQIDFSKPLTLRKIRETRARIRQAFRGVVNMRLWPWMNDLLDGPLQAAISGRGLAGFYASPDFKAEVELRRGFPEEFKLPLAAWQAHGPAVVRRHPVREVRITDREPPHLPEWPCWMVPFAEDRPDALPADWYEAVGRQHGVVRRSMTWLGFDTEANAHAAVSAAAIAWAKSQPA